MPRTDRRSIPSCHPNRRAPRGAARAVGVTGTVRYHAGGHVHVPRERAAAFCPLQTVVHRRTQQAAHQGGTTGVALLWLSSLGDGGFFVGLLVTRAFRSGRDGREG